MINKVLSALIDHNARVGAALNFTPSENRLSPLARLPLVSDLYCRYFLDDLKLFGEWAFYGGKDVGNIENNILHPCLQRLTGALHVNARPISGINCMTVALAAITEPGDAVFAIPLEFGGHASTQIIIESMGRTFVEIPMISHCEIDLLNLTQLFHEQRPRLIYIDQATMLFPLELPGVRSVINEVSPHTILHYDSSHLNGLILGGENPNPLEHGADIFGGSTHKTLPGPHKGFLVTNNDEIASKISEMASHFVSHHHSAEMVSLAITLLEFEQCGGNDYARKVVENAKIFGRQLHEAGVDTAAHEMDFTGCHQVWVTPPENIDANALARDFEDCGLILNVFGGLPGINRPSFRVSLAEVTRMKATHDHAKILADIFADLILGRKSKNVLQSELKIIKSELSTPGYCVDLEALSELKLDAPVHS